ncbi:hypothetical protein ARTSIC4J27_2193 [Pseudarthrobacter siccitolerans]|uniref:Uncharacterized protein n=1 Tax=Pseudarthrobacter siccitolerans TaxID=861266 RepID=A0A024H2I4_9MICC|nr:hypothetical protein ARTSIC4J27_2193 [Pseudarthrobacter siccitolerans]
MGLLVAAFPQVKGIFMLSNGGTGTTKSSSFRLLADGDRSLREPI